MQLYDKLGKELNPDTLASLVKLNNGKTVEEVLQSLPTNEEFKLTQVRYYSSDTTNKNELESIKWDSWVENISSLNLNSHKYIWAHLKTEYGTATDSTYFIIYVRPTPKMIYLSTKTQEEMENINVRGKLYTELIAGDWTEYPQEIKDAKIYSWGIPVDSNGICAEALLIGKYPE